MAIHLDDVSCRYGAPMGRCDSAGREWNGRGAGPGMACTLRLAACSKQRAA